jgi:ATP-dependent helicase/nuclease subunit A
MSQLHAEHARQAAFEHNGKPVSRQGFYAIACDPERSVAVEACAGAGKTWMLVSRIVRALVEGSAPHEILAITFTKKAAGEMRQRLQQWLQKFSTDSDEQLCLELQSRGVRARPTPAQLQTLRGLHTHLLRSSRPVQIRTFHSWFAALLRSAPLSVLHNLGLPGQYELLEDDAPAIAQVWRRFQARVVKDAAAHRDYFESVAKYGRHQTYKALEAALSKRVEFALADARGVVNKSVAHFTEQFPAFAGVQHPEDCLSQSAILEKLWAAAKSLGQCNGKTCQKAASELEAALTLGQSDPLADWKTGVKSALLTQSGTPRKLTDKLVNLDNVAIAQDDLRAIGQATQQHDAWQHQQRMARLVRVLAEEFAHLKRENNWVDMGDLERAALVLMTDSVLSAWVQERLDARVRHLLIDEFQDTNPLQWQALRAWLSGYSGAVGHALSVFMVGDPKQSIYRFRRAEPQVFVAAKAFIQEGLGGDVLSCDHTHRNAASIIGLVNTTFTEAQAAHRFAGFRTHTTESAAIGHCYRLPRLLRDDVQSPAPDADADANTTATTTAWRNSLTTPRHAADENRKSLECRQAAQWLHQQLHMSGTTLRPADIMVLSRKRERLGLMQAELAALHIAAQQPEKARLIDAPEVQDIVALLDALVSPRHNLSLARALKSPLFGVQDEDLVVLAQAVRAAQAVREASSTQPAPSWYQVLQSPALLAQCAPQGECPAALGRAALQLAQWRSWVQEISPHDALNAIYHQGQVLSRFAAASPAGQRESVVANLQTLLSTTLQLDGGRYLNAYGLVRALRKGDIAAAVRAQTQAVRLLTVHGAKGLEAPLVLLLDTDAEAPTSESMGILVQWPGETSHPERFAFVASESKPSACMVQALEQEKQARQREELNTLYVALTRAAHTLVVSAAQPHRGADLSWWQQLEPGLEAAPQGTPRAPAAPEAENAPKTEFSMFLLPNMPLAGVFIASDAIKSIAPLETKESLLSRVGQAMHRLLEYAPTTTAPAAALQWSAAQSEAVAQQFALAADDIAQAQAQANTIYTGQGGWAWDASVLRWHGNEVALQWGGQLLRIDRLVQRQDTGQWWVLDYKTTASPHTQSALRTQLRTYQEAVQHMYPEHSVRAAFLTAQGDLIELEGA